TGLAAAQTGFVDLVDTTDTRAIAVSPTGLAVAKVHAGQVLRSSDSGATWTQGPFDTTRTVSGVTICDDGSVFAGTYSGMFKSTDEAMTWELLGQQPSGPFFDIHCLPNSTDLLLPEPSLTLYALRDNGTWYDSLFAKPYDGK